MILNKLKINDDKRELLVISSERSPYHLHAQLKIGSSSIFPSNSCHNLGVMFDKHAMMDAQINGIRHSTHFLVRTISSIWSMVTETATTQLVHSLVTSHLDCRNSLLYGLPDSQSDRLQHIQNIACRVVVELQRKNVSFPT